MGQFNVVNLVQFGTAVSAILGCLLLWRVKEFRGIALLLCIISVASFINIIEEARLFPEWFLISPIFIMLFGPATYLASKFAVNGYLSNRDYCHFLPVLLLVFFTSHVQIVIAIGTVWRLIYTVFTVKMLLNYKKVIDEQRSDSDEYSLNWLVILVCVMALFNTVDLIRLNLQPLLTVELNVLGQGINNVAWLIACMIIIYKFSELNGLPLQHNNSDEKICESRAQNDHYKSLFDELEKQIFENQWYLTPRITLATISDFTGLQTRDISRAINLHANKSFNEYINYFRVQKVCDQLEVNSEQSLTTISFAAGFSSKASFNKVFKQIIGKTPSEYKASLQS